MFRRRLTYASAAAVAVAVVLASVVTWMIVRSELRGKVDEGLSNAAEPFTAADTFTERAPAPGIGMRIQRILRPTPLRESNVSFIQAVAGDGAVIGPNRDFELPVDDQTREIAATGEGSAFRDDDIGGVHVRVHSVGVEPGLAVQLMQPLEGTDDLLQRLALLLLFVSLGGIGLAVFLARGVTSAAIAPVTHLTDAAEHVTRTRDLSRRIEAEGDDEVARLATSFNTMLEALESSMRAQRQLVADASHELRTPLTSLRTNIEVLAGGRLLLAEDRERLLRDVVGQLEELTLLVSDLVDLARGDEPLRERENVRLDQLVDQAISRARRHHPDRLFVADLQPVVVNGVPARLDRAVGNLLDNAVKWGPPGEAVEVRVREGEVTVRDHGPGFAPSDLPLVFDRFYRADSARGMPGSGLGLAIVRQVAESHGGHAMAENAPDGGARLRLSLVNS